MLTRELASQIQNEWLQSTNMSLSSIRQFEAMMRAALALTGIKPAASPCGFNRAERRVFLWALAEL